jgi:hypothetical protein
MSMGANGRARRGEGTRGLNSNAAVGLCQAEVSCFRRYCASVAADNSKVDEKLEYLARSYTKVCIYFACTTPTLMYNI